jgi:uncharacterized membrane protein YgdD (TMEM256/DUF423 family)
MKPTSRTALLAAGILGATGVGLGALGAHALAPTLADRGMTLAWETGARYHIFHALALLAAAAWLQTADPSAGNVAARRIQWAVRCWTVGTVLFAGSLYGIALAGWRWLGPVTPLGGVALLLGWGFVIAAALAKEKTE